MTTPPATHPELGSARRRPSRNAFVALAVLAVILSAPGAALAGAPPPRSLAEVEGVLARSPGPPPLERQRPITIVLLANEKDHGPEEHDYPLWQKRWTSLLGGKAEGEDGRANLHGPAPASPAAREVPGVTVVTAWGWPEESVLETANVVVAFIGTGGRWSPERIASLDRYLARGGGFVALHSAVITGPDLAKDLAARIGLAWQDGITTFRHGRLDLEVRALEHPICLGLPGTIRFEDESYWPLVGDPASVDVLATADERMPPGPGGTPAPQPMVWTATRGKGRVFGCLLGHYTWTFDDPYFRILALRGIAWAARESPFRFDPLVLRDARTADGSEPGPEARRATPVPPRAPAREDPRLVLWLDASDRSTVTVDPDGLVSDWSSRAGRGRGLSSQGAQRPAYAADGIGGKPAIRFDGRDDVLRDTGFRGSVSDWTLIVVAAVRSNAGGFRGLFASNETGQNDFLSGINVDLGGQPTDAFDALNLEGSQHEGQSNLKDEASAFGAHVVTIVRGGGRAQAWVDGVAEGERASRDVEASLEELRIGCRNYENPAGKLPLVERGTLDGDIAEVLLWNAPLSDEERAGIEAWLLSKYGAAVVEAREPTLDGAFEALPAWDEGAPRRPLGPIDAAIAASTGDAAARAALEARLLGVLAGASTASARDWVCRRLGAIGTPRCIPAVAELLPDERLSHPARVALERIGGPAAAEALRDALGKTEGRVRAGIVDSLGRLGDASSAGALERLLGDPDPAVGEAAAAALGALGAADPLLALVARGAGRPAEAAAWALVDLGHRLCDGGRPEEAARIFGALAGNGPGDARIAALRGLARASPERARPALEAARSAGDDRVRKAVDGILSGLDGAGSKESGAR